MPINIQPSQSPLGLFGGMLGGLSTGYASGYAKMAPVLQQAGQAGGQAKLSAMNQMAGTFGDAYRSAYNQSFGFLANTAYQQQAQDNRLAVMDRAHTQAMESLGAETLSSANRAFIQKGMPPVTDITDPGTGAVAVPGITGTMYRDAVSKGQFAGSPIEFYQSFVQQQQEQMQAAEWAKRGLKMDYVNDTDRALAQKIEADIASLSAGEGPIVEANPEFRGLDIQHQRERQAAIAKLRAQMPKKDLVPINPTADQLKQSVTPIANPDGSTAGWVYPKGVSFTQNKPPAAGKGADAAAQPKLPPNTFEGPDGYLYAPHPSGDGPLQPVLGKRGPWAGKQITASQYRYERDSVQDDNGNWLVPKYNNDGVLVGHVPNPFNLQDQKAQDTLRQEALKSEVKLTLEQWKARNAAIDEDVGVMRKQAESAIKSAGDPSDAGFREKLRNISADALLKLDDPGAFETKVRAEAERRVDQKMRQSQSGSSTPAPPQVGEVRRGWQFIGGDPANPTSWRKVQ